MAVTKWSITTDVFDQEKSEFIQYEYIAPEFTVKRTEVGVEVLHRPNGTADYSVAFYPWHRIRRVMSYGTSDHGVRS